MDASDSERDIGPQGGLDERDERDVLADPQPARSAADFSDPDDDPAAVHEAALALAVSQQVTVITRPLPAEGVPNCSIRIGSATGTTNGNGNATD